MSIENYNPNRLNSNEELAKCLEEAAETTSIKLEKFIGIYPEADVKRDQEYVNRNERFFEDSKNQRDYESNYHPKALENIATHNINRGAWLKNPEDNSYSIEAKATSRYDDILNRIDLIVEVHSEQENADFPYGLDITTIDDEDLLRYKLLYNSNDKNFDGDIGTGRIKYHEDAMKNRGNIRCLPRYCIGVSHETVDTLLEKTHLNENNEVTELDDDFATQYKILTELSAQNQLFIKRLSIKEDNDNITDEQEAMLDYLWYLDGIFTDELSRVKKNLPDWATAWGKEDNFITARLIKGQERKDNTFGNILKVVRELDEELDNDPDALDKYLAEYRQDSQGDQDKKSA